MLLPFILLALDRFRPDGEPARRLNAPRQWLVLSLCFTLAGYIVLREEVLKLRFYWERGFLDWTIQPMIRSVGMDRWLMPLVLLGHYAALLLFPMKLSPDYGGSAIGWQVNLHDPYLYLGIATAVACGFALVYSILRRRWVLLFALIGLGLSYGLVGNIATLIGTNFGERLMYLPSVFFLLIAAMGLARLPRRVLVPAMSVVLLLGCARTVTYAAMWNDRLTFYRYCVRQNPGAIRLYMLLADEQMKRGDLEGAQATTAAGRALQGDYWDIYCQSALVAERLGTLEEADAFLGRAMDIRPSVSIAKQRNEVRLKRFPATTQALK
jgi:tetratricopeptide (TPR) repeat protein